MMEEFMELLKKKAKEQKGPKMDEKMSAKASMAKELSDMLAGDLSEGIQNSKKVMVSSDSEEGLKKGLEKAEDILDKKLDMKKDMMEDDSEEVMEEDSEDDSEEVMEEDSEDDLKSQVAMLKKEIENLKKR